jgi:hypothetical protein
MVKAVPMTAFLPSTSCVLCRFGIHVARYLSPQ